MKKRKEKKTIKQLISILCIAILCSIILFGCSIPAGGSGESKKSQYIEKNDSSISDDSSISTKIIGSYPKGKGYYDNDLLNFGNSSSIVDKYNAWKEYHVTSDGANGYLRVKRDPSSLEDTVSEGIGYGMLLAVYFNDQKTFDGLYNYCKYHFIKVNGTKVPLMHWKVNAGGYDASEFADYAMDPSVIKVSNTSYLTWAAIVPHSIVYGNLKTGRVFITRTGSQYDSLRAALDNNPDYYRMCSQDRGYSCATDSDEDIAAALCFASKKNWTSSINYRQEATNMINAMKQYDFTSDGFIKNGNTWGGQNGWNPSYFAPGYYINVYQKHTGDYFWTTVYNRMYTEMSIVKNIILYRNGNNESKVFFPDWCDTSNSGLKKATNTDRIYYNDVATDKPGPSNGPGEPYIDARWTDNTTKEQYKSSFVSFNSYYDGIRVPWRIATDYLWGGTRAAEIMPVVNKSFQNYFNYNNTGKEMGDGCSITGGIWNPADRDGFNRSGGGGTPSGVFKFMAACSQMVNGVYSDPKFSEVRNSSLFWAKYCYYTNCMNLFASLMLSGKFQNLYDNKSSDPNTQVLLYRYWNGYQNYNDHFYTLDYSELGSGNWGWVYEFAQCFIYKTSVIDGGKTKPLYRLCYSATNTTDHFYTTDWNEVLTFTYKGYSYEGIAGNVYTTQYNGTKPLYRYYSSGATDHFYTTNWDEIGNGKWGYVYEGIACYVK